MPEPTARPLAARRRLLAPGLCAVLALSIAGSVAAQEPWWPSVWGPEDERGAVNRLGPDKVLEAAALIERGVVYSLGRTYEDGMPLFGTRHYRLTIPGVPRDASVPDGPIFNDELLSAQIGQVGTQFDGLGHVGLRVEGVDRYYNGVPGSDMYGPGGLEKLGIENVGPIVTRGVLIDVARHLGQDRLPAGTVITPAHLEGALAAQGVEVREGDAVFIRTGHAALWMADDAAYNAGEPGIGVAAGEWLVERGIVLAGADNWGNEVVPSEDPGAPFPVHRLFMLRNGIYNLENLTLDALAADEVWEFAFMFSPLPLKGATGSPGNPIAIR